MKVHRIEQVAVVVRDMEAAKNFFLALGLEIEGEVVVKGDAVDRIVDLKGTNSTIVMLKTSEGDAKVELIRYNSPLFEGETQPAVSNTPGIRHFLLSVDDIETAVEQLKAHGGETVGEIVNYENMYKLCYIRGPEGIFIELAEKL